MSEKVNVEVLPTPFPKLKVDAELTVKVPTVSANPPIFNVPPLIVIAVPSAIWFAAPNNSVPPLFTAIELPEIALVVLFCSCRVPALTAEAPLKVFGEAPLITIVPAPSLVIPPPPLSVPDSVVVVPSLTV